MVDVSLTSELVSSSLILQIRPVLVPFMTGQLRLKLRPPNDNSSKKKTGVEMIPLSISSERGSLPIYATLSSSSDTVIQMMIDTEALRDQGIEIHILPSLAAHSLYSSLPSSSTTLLETSSNYTVESCVLDVEPLLYTALKNCFSTDQNSFCSASSIQNVALGNAARGPDKAIIASLECEIRLTIESVSASALTAMGASFNSTLNKEEDASGEIRLKQAFVAADTDSSGFVSYEEVNCSPLFYKLLYVFIRVSL